MVEMWCGIPLILIGFENDRKDGTGEVLNAIASNGKQEIRLQNSRRSEKDPMFTHLLPADSHKKIGSVEIYFERNIKGFSFYDKQG
jgi:hypothetical protein